MEKIFDFLHAIKLCATRYGINLMTVRTQVVIAIIKNKIGNVLLLKRLRVETAKDGAQLMWAFPGGKPNTGESLEDAVVREVKQETGFNITVLEKISERSHPQFPAHIIYFACELADFRVKPILDIHEVSEIKWVEPTALSNYFTSDLDAHVAKSLGI